MTATFKKPFRAVPIKKGKRYRNRQRKTVRKPAIAYLGAAALGGALLGTASIAFSEGGTAAIISRVKPVAVALGFARERAPQQGDYWLGCNNARNMGTAPIYYGEPGYREGLDGDNDGIACEPYRGV